MDPTLMYGMTNSMASKNLLRLAVKKKKGVPSAVGFPHCAGSGEGLFLSLKPYPHKCD